LDRKKVELQILSKGSTKNYKNSRANRFVVFDRRSGLSSAPGQVMTNWIGKTKEVGRPYGTMDEKNRVRQKKE
jgi:hypothetical protein